MSSNSRNAAQAEDDPIRKEPAPDFFNVWGFWFGCVFLPLLCIQYAPDRWDDFPKVVRFLTATIILAVYGGAVVGLLIGTLIPAFQDLFTREAPDERPANLPVDPAQWPYPKRDQANSPAVCVRPDTEPADIRPR